MLETGSESFGRQNHLDYDVHGLVGIRLVDPSPTDAAAVARQLGPLESPLSRKPDIIVRFVKHLPTARLRYLGLKDGFTDDGFFILQSGKKESKVRIAFDQIGGQCEIVCQSGLRSVPLLMAILNLTALKKDCVALHASAFVYEGKGILVTGWAKGGKTESLLAFASQGAKYVGDEWILLRGDGNRMYGIPENIRLWNWHLEYLPEVRRQIGTEERALFRLIESLDGMQRLMVKGRLGNMVPVKFLRQAMPALRRQLNVTLEPRTIFGAGLGSLTARPERVFLLVSHEDSRISVQATDPLEIARRMASSIQYEQIPFLEHYLAFKFAFPQRRNAFIERAAELQYSILRRALAGKLGYCVRHPYPVSLPELYNAMRPYCEGSDRIPALEQPHTSLGPS